MNQESSIKKEMLIMELALIITGAVAIIISVIAGIGAESFFGFLIYLVSGVSLALILFAFSQIITNQLNILQQLQMHNDFTRHLNKKEVKCPDCNHMHEDIYSSCPNCGYRKQK